MKKPKDLFIISDKSDKNGVWPSMFHSGKTKQTHPYNYDPFFIWNTGEKAKESIYTDRLYSWNHKKHDELCKKHFGNQGQYWNTRDPEAIQEFLKDWTENPDVKLVFIIEYCNMSNGYPCWCLGFTY